MFLIKKTCVFFCLMFIILFTSCKSTINAQDKSVDTMAKEDVKKEKPKFSEKDIFKKIDPNAIELMGEVITINENIELCGKKHEYTITVKVQKVISTGSATIYKVKNDTNLTMILPSKLLLASNKKSPSSLFKKGDLCRFSLLENLCEDTRKTAHHITSFKIL